MAFTRFSVTSLFLGTLLSAMSLPALAEGGRLLEVIGSSFTDPDENRGYLSLRNNTDSDLKCTIKVTGIITGSKNGQSLRARQEADPAMGFILKAGRQAETGFDFTRAVNKMRTIWGDEKALLSEIDERSIFQECSVNLAGEVSEEPQASDSCPPHAPFFSKRESKCFEQARNGWVIIHKDLSGSSIIEIDGVQYTRGSDLKARFWEGADAYCKSLNYQGREGWSLPSPEIALNDLSDGSAEIKEYLGIAEAQVPENPWNRYNASEFWTSARGNYPKWYEVVDFSIAQRSSQYGNTGLGVICRR